MRDSIVKTIFVKLFYNRETKDKTESKWKLWKQKLASFPYLEWRRRIPCNSFTPSQKPLMLIDEDEP